VLLLDEDGAPLVETAARLRGLPAQRPPLILLGVAGGRDVSVAAGDAFDGVVLTDDPELPLATTRRPRAHADRRRHARAAARMHVSLEGTPPLDGTTLDVSLEGAAVRLPQPPAGAWNRRVVFSRCDGRSVTTLARATWVRSGGDGEVLVGLHLIDGTAAARNRWADLALWERVEIGGEAVIRLHGELGARTALWPLIGELQRRRSVLDLAAVQYATLFGVCHFARFLEQAARRRRPRLRNVPDALAQQRWLAALMRARCELESFGVRCDCPRCGVEVRLVGCKAPGPVRCPLCRESVDYGLMP
jgi:hypothetical protein